LALIPIGYADGFPRLLSNRGTVLIGGQRVPVVGRVSMDQIMADVSSLPNVQEGDEVVILGSQGKASVTPDEVAELSGTISYEVLTGLGRRIKRVYAD
jgi:alanine racemase